MKANTWEVFKTFVDSESLSIQVIDVDDRYLMKSSSNTFELEFVMIKSTPPKAPQIDFEANYQTASNIPIINTVTTSAFSDKADLFFRGQGVKQTISANSTESIIYTMAYPKGKLNGMEIMFGNDCDTCNFKLLDDTSGTYSTVPNYLLNQFGFDWNIKKEGLKEILPYDADIFYGMQLVVEYTNNSDTDTEIGVNFHVHEDKS